MSDRTRYRFAGAMVAVIVAAVVLAAFSALDLDDSPRDPGSLSIDAPVYASSVDQFVTDSTAATAVGSSGPMTAATPQPSPGPVESVTQAADVTARAERGSTIPGPTLPPPPTTIPPPVDGDCESWRPLLERFGIPYAEALPYMRRESQCSMAHNGNADTEDDSFGPLQANRYGDLAAWWDSGGYTRAVMATPEGSVAAAAVLYHSCGWGPWHRSEGYPCYGDYLDTPAPRWGEW